MSVSKSVYFSGMLIFKTSVHPGKLDLGSMLLFIIIDQALIHLLID